MNTTRKRLALLLKRAHPETTVVGFNADPQALKPAHRKLTQPRLQVTLAEGTVTALPYSDRSFDRVLSGLLFYHLAMDLPPPGMWQELCLSSSRKPVLYRDDRGHRTRHSLEL